MHHVLSLYFMLYNNKSHKWKCSGTRVFDTKHTIMFSVEKQLVREYRRTFPRGIYTSP